MFLFTGYFFFAYNLYGNTNDMRAIFSTLFAVVLFLIPILTMRLMSEDKKLKTDQLLLTAPVSRTALVLGKYLAAVCVYLLSIMSTMVAAVVVARLAPPEWPVIFGNFIGLFLLGITLIAICLFLSSLTESQVIAAIGGFAVSFFLMLIDTLAPVISIPAVGRILESLSFQNRYASFTLGVLNAADIIFFLSIAAMFLCFTIGVLEKLFQKKLYFWILMIILVLGVFMLNLVLSLADERYELGIDLTENKLFDISEESKALIASLQDEVQIHVLAKEADFTGSSTYMAQANAVIRQYDKLGSTITVDYVNYVADPTFASKYPDAVMSHGDLLVTCGSKHRVIAAKELFNYTYDSKGNSTIASSKADQVLSAALLSVTGGEQVTVNFITGNGEYTMPSFEALLKNNNFEAAAKNLVTEDLDSGCKVAVLISPHSDLSPEVIDKLDKFLYNQGEYGKTLLYTADAEQKPLPNLEAFLKEWGVEIGGGAVFETKETRVFNYHPFYAVADYVDETYQGMLRDMTTPMLMPISRPLSVLFDYRNNNSVKVLLEFGKTAAVRPADATDSFTQADATVRGPIPALVLASYTVKDKETGKAEKQSNVLVSGSSGMLDSYSIDNSSLSNSEYLLNVLNTLTDKQETIKIQSKTITGKELNLSTAAANRLGLIFALLIPLAIIGAGIGIWLYRRHK